MATLYDRLAAGAIKRFYAQNPNALATASGVNKLAQDFAGGPAAQNTFVPGVAEDLALQAVAQLNQRNDNALGL